MTSLDSILSNPDKFFSTGEIARALRTTTEVVVSWCKKNQLKYEIVSNRRIIKGKWLKDYLVKQNG